MICKTSIVSLLFPMTRTKKVLKKDPNAGRSQPVKFLPIPAGDGTNVPNSPNNNPTPNTGGGGTGCDPVPAEIFVRENGAARRTRENTTLLPKPLEARIWKTTALRQRRANLLLRKLLFIRLVRQVLQDHKGDARLPAAVIHEIQLCVKYT